jgi:calpain-15
VDKFDINDIKQGILGDCYFLSSVSAIAEYAERFNKIFIHKEVSKNGCITVQFFINGKPKIITIDDHFPCIQRQGKLKWAFASSGENELWVSVLEKAWAKVCGSYAHTIAGLPSEAMATLTEAPTISYIHKRLGKDKIWQELLAADTNKFIICTNSSEECNSKEVGIYPSHAYTFIGCKEVDGMRFVQLRNPWGGFEWKGDYSDNSTLWTDRLKKELGYVKAEDGAFFMLFDDFFKYFPYTFSCKYHDHFYYNYKKFKPSEATNMVCSRFTVTKDGAKVYVGLHQKTARFYKKIKNYKVAFGRLIVAKYDEKKIGNNYEYIGSEFANTEKIYVTLDNLTAGDYHVFAQVNWQYSEPCSIVISSYASDNAPICLLPREEVPNNYLNQILTSFVKTKGKKATVNKDVSFYYSIEDNHTGYFITCYENSSQRESVHVNFEATCNQYVNLASKHLGHRDSKNQIDNIGFYIPPTDCKTIVFEVCDIYKSDLKIGKYRVDTVPNYVKTEDAVKLYLARHIDHLEKEQISKDCIYTEFHENNHVYLVFMNNGEVNYSFAYTLNNVENLKPCFTNERNVVNVRSHSFEYMKFEVIDPKNNYDIRISYKFKEF